MGATGSFLPVQTEPRRVSIGCQSAAKLPLCAALCRFVPVCATCSAGKIRICGRITPSRSRLGSDPIPRGLARISCAVGRARPLEWLDYFRAGSGRPSRPSLGAELLDPPHGDAQARCRLRHGQGGRRHRFLVRRQPPLPPTAGTRRSRPLGSTRHSTVASFIC